MRQLLRSDPGRYRREKRTWRGHRKPGAADQKRCFERSGARVSTVLAAAQEDRRAGNP